MTLPPQISPPVIKLMAPTPRSRGTSTKRKRPSYSSLFPPLEEFDEVESRENDGDDDADQAGAVGSALGLGVRPVSRRCDVHWEGDESLTVAAALEGSDGGGSAPRPRQTQLDGGFGTSDSGREKRSEDGIARRGVTNFDASVTASHLPFPPSTAPAPSADPTTTAATHQTSNGSRFLFVPEGSPASISKTNPRCNRCILIRRKCDGVRPACRLCAMSQKVCVYEKEAITRSYLERMQNQAQTLREGGAGVGLTGAMLRGGSGGTGGVEAERRDQQRQEVRRTKGPDPRRSEETRELEVIAAKWTYADHVETLRRLDAGKKPVDHGLFDETTAMYEDFRRQEGSVADEWSREQHGNLDINWIEIRDDGRVKEPFVPGVNCTGEGFLSSLRLRVGLPGSRQTRSKGP